MAYSLKNHEDRIVALEKSGGSLNITKLYEGATKSLSLNLSSYDIVFIHCGANPSDGQTCFGVTYFPKQQSKLQAGCLTNSAYHATFTFTPTSQTVTHRGGSDVNRIRAVYGLTIYYIVRYNIYNKILSMIKFQAVSEIFTKILEKNGGEEMAISLKNVDDRLKRLESAGIQCSLTNIFFDTNAPIVGTRTFTVDLLDYDFLLVSGAGSGHSTGLVNTPCQTILIPTSILIRGDKIIQADWYTSDRYDNFYLSYSGTSLTFKGGGNASPDGQLYFVIGVKLTLKIYYIFRYNIYVKFIRSINSILNNLLVKFISSSPKIFSKGGIEFGY